MLLYCHSARTLRVNPFGLTLKANTYPRVGCTLFPLLLHVLSLRLRNMSTGLDLNEHDDANHPDQTQHNLMLLLEAMQVYRLRHSGIDWVLDAVRTIIGRFCQSFPRYSLSRSSKVNQHTASWWGDLLLYQPKFYLFLSSMLNLCLKNGRIPDTNDLPLDLRLMASYNDLPTATQLFPNGIPESLNLDDFIILSGANGCSLTMRPVERFQEAGVEADDNEFNI